MQKTVLNSLHAELGARLVEFAGFEMPVLYQDITAEHQTVRNAVGVFDLSHMGRVRFTGPRAMALANRVQTFDAESMQLGRVRYALMLTPEGTVLDDILISRETDGFLLVINAGNRSADLEVIHAEAKRLGATVRDDSEDIAMVALQGPNAATLMQRLGLGFATSLKYYCFVDGPSDFGNLTVSRTGYTGEDGFEILVPRDHACALFKAALQAGEDLGARPCGLGCRDTLRLEAGMPLYGHEMDLTVNPFEAALDHALRSKADYIGSPRIAALSQSAPMRRLCALFVDGPQIPRQGHEIVAGGQVVGVVCSGTRSPTLGRNIATARIDSAVLDADAALSVRIRRNEVGAQKTILPFYSRKRASGPVKESNS
ncbi:MAG: glycine cleavage system aminomethyltransferase GcvT [Planctomycetes bacterium]|nr:glycine cleavage system aminomethyltransferase GcvT [Planctomycetota bacterium]